MDASELCFTRGAPPHRPRCCTFLAPQEAPLTPADIFFRPPFAVAAHCRLYRDCVRPLPPPPAACAPATRLPTTPTVRRRRVCHKHVTCRLHPAGVVPLALRVALRGEAATTPRRPLPASLNTFNLSVLSDWKLLHPRPLLPEAWAARTLS
jgi:hypothetical protein